MKMKYCQSILITFMVVGFLTARPLYQAQLHSEAFPSLNRGTGLDVAPEIMLSWAGAGFLTTYTISNTGQNGIFEPPPGWDGYDGMWPTGFGYFNGRTGEFPKGTEQFYTWGSGLWIGAKSDQFNAPEDKSITVGNVTIENVRVAACAYYSEMSTISKLWQSDQTINAQNDLKDEENKGEFLFGQKNKSMESFQDPWSFYVPNVGDYYSPEDAVDTLYRLEHEPINVRRRAFLQTAAGLDSNRVLLDPFRVDENGVVHGDVVSDEDTYAVFGDYIQERYGNFLWTGGYDERSLGVKVEQRTYSWVTDDFLYINYKITNMNDFPLDSVFVGYFMDNDVGYADDDLIGFDRSLNLGYSYDSDLEETGWVAPAGYLGSVYVETPVDSVGDPVNGIPASGNELDDWEIGLTGFQTWIRSDLGQSEGHPGDVDDSEVDHLKYFQLSLTDSFEVYEEPQDVRQLATSGPVIQMLPGETISITIALVAGSSLADLKENTQAAIDKFDSGYIGAEAPPSPGLTVQPAHEAVYLSWDAFPETVKDPFTGKTDFAGYRVYRSTTGLQGDWIELAEYDVDGDSSEWSGTMSYTTGTSNAIGEFVGPLGTGDISAQSSIDAISDRFKEGEYTIEFVSGTIDTGGGSEADTLKMVIYNVTNRTLVQPNLAAMSTGEGFRTYSAYDTSAKKASGGMLTDIDVYRPGYYIYLDGFFVRISSGEYKDLDLDGTISATEISQQSLNPQEGDVFTIQSFAADDVGDQTGLEYVYLDEGLVDGLTYFYSVTSFDMGEPTLGIPSLESSIYQNLITVMPQHMSLELAGKPEISDYTKEGPSTSEFLKAITAYENLTGHHYRINFYKTDPFDETSKADYGLLTDSSMANIGVANESLIGLNSGTAYKDTFLIGGRDTDGDGDISAGDNLPNGIIVPGTVLLTVGSTTLTDQGDGIIQGIVGSDTVKGTIHYGQSTIALDATSATTLGTGNVSVDYQYNPTVLKNSSNSAYTGTLSPGGIFYIATIDTGDNAVDHGFIFMVTNPTLEVDSVYWNLGANAVDLFRFSVSESNLEPYDYYITFFDESDSASAPTSAWADFKEISGDSSYNPQRVPLQVTNQTLGESISSFNTGRISEKKYLWWDTDSSTANSKNKFNVLTREAQVNTAVSPYSFKVIFQPFDDNITGGSVLDAPAGINNANPDTLFVRTSRPLTEEDIFRFYTVNMLDTLSMVSLDDIRVVPNPYIIRAAWDHNRFNQRIDFRHLPSECTIRIFNVAGEWVATLKKDNMVGDNEIKDEEGTLAWDLRNFEGLKVASGLYLYHLEGKLFGKTVTKEGKFAIVLGP